MATKLAIAMKAYNNPCCASVADFEEDFKRPLKIKRMLAKWRRTGTLPNARIIVNNLVTIFNVFEPGFALRHLRETVGDENEVGLNTFLLYMRRSMDFVNVDKTLYAHVKREIEG